jgi:hypothetical protein
MLFLIPGNTSSNFLAIDFEKHPLNCEADFGVGVSLEPVEIVYHEVNEYEAQHHALHFIFTAI